MIAAKQCGNGNKIIAADKRMTEIMLTKDDVREVLKIYGSLYDMSDDVSLVVLCRENFEYSDLDYADVHIGIEFEYGDFLELHEDDPAFQYISKLCSLPTDVEEIVLYSKE